MPKTKALFDAILKWREHHAIEVLGENVVYEYGARFFMADCLVDEVVACAEAGKLKSVADMDKEGLQMFDWAEKYKPSLVELVLEHYPVSSAEAPDQVAPPAPQPAASTSSTEDLAANMNMLRISNSNQGCSGPNIGGSMEY